MTWKEFVLAVACAHKLWRNVDTAFVVDGGVVQHIGEQSATYTYDTPVVNILQNLGVSAVQKKWLYCTYKLSEMDLGMACMRKVAGVTYLDAGAVRDVMLSDETGPSAPKEPGGSAFDVTTWPDRNKDKENPGGATRWSNTSWATNWYKWLDKNPKFVSKDAFTLLESYAGKAAKALTARPAEDIKTLQSILSLGLDGMADAPALQGPVRDRFFMLAALALVGRSLSTQASGGAVRGGDAPGGHNIGGILLNSSNKIIAWGINMMTLNGTFHAETGMILAYLRRHNTNTLPENCRLFTTLQPCHMCSGFIATVAKNITVVIGQQDPKISNSALAKGRGDNVSEIGFAHPLPDRRDMPKVQWNLGDVLEDLISRSGQNAVPFLYSPQAMKIFKELRGRPDMVDKVVKELSKPAPLAMTPKHPLATDSPGRGLDLAGHSLASTPVTLDALRGGGKAAVQGVQAMQKLGGQVSLSGASRNIQGLDLAVGNINAAKHLSLPAADPQIKPLIQAMAAICGLLNTLKDRGAIEF